MKKKHVSLRRNKAICSVFYDRGIIESWGTGTNQMVQRCLDLEVPEPEFSEVFGGVNVKFLFKEPIITIMKRRKVEGKPAILSPRQEEILTILANNKQLTRREIVIHLESLVPARTVQRDLAGLKEMNLIDHRGQANNLVWFLIPRKKT